MCGRAGAHTGARDGRADGVRPVGCSTSEQSASRASAPAHTRHTRRTGPTRTTRHTPPARAASASAWTPATRAARAVGPRTRCAMRNAQHGTARGTRCTGVGAQIKDQRNARRGTTHTRETRPPHAHPYDMRASTRSSRHDAGPRTSRDAHGHTAHGRTARGTDAPAGSWRVARRSGVQNLNSRPHAHAGRNGVARAPPYDMRAGTRENRPRARAPYDMRVRARPLRYARARAAPRLWAPPPPPAPVSRHLSRLTGRGRRVGGGCSESEQPDDAARRDGLTRRRAGTG